MPEALTPGLRRWTVLAALACLLPLLPLVPGGVAVLAMVLGRVGLVSRRAWPAWLRALLLFCLVGYVLASHGFRLGRDTGCALLACLLAIKPLETRKLRDAHSLLGLDRKSTRLNSSHVKISYAVFCLKKKTTKP